MQGRKPLPTDWVCPTCGDDKILVLDWVRVNTSKPLGDPEAGDYYCGACDDHFKSAVRRKDFIKPGGPCDCWEGCNDREGKRPCEHERLLEGGGPFNNSRKPGKCRCGAIGPPWKHAKTCAYD